jgi:hydroxymethylglutaryl-CoA reductase (NADPH)
VKKIPIVPGRSLNTLASTSQRSDFLKNAGHTIHNIQKSALIPEEINNNIESFIGSVEIPLGLVGPLLFNDGDKQELVYAAGGTLEGALIASMNRGAKTINWSGGFNAEVIHQKMVRSPMFVFENLKTAVRFRDWILSKYDIIKKTAESYSNHAKLISLDPHVTGKSVHLKFVYTTGDASGQNMTTSCTWQAVLWIRENFEKETGFVIVQSVIEGNGASDKKVSHYAAYHGRGIHVIAECELEENYINRILRTSSAEMLSSYHASLTMTRLDGMMGYNINVANAIASIFVATGQDLASIHESGLGFLHLEKTDKGLYLSLHLPTLVIGTVGGGTGLPKQREALELMGCYGSGRVNRFAQLIAGFALGLEISTFAAVVGDNFATSHEKMGRNKPVNWLTRSEVNTDFVQKYLKKEIKDIASLESIQSNVNEICEDGILMSLAQKVNKKFKGFVILNTDWKYKSGAVRSLPDRIIIKSKPVDHETIMGLHYMASAIDPELANLITANHDDLEYKSSHTKEINIYDYLDHEKLNCTPLFLGSTSIPEREVFMLFMSFLHKRDQRLFNTENSPELWTTDDIRKTIGVIHQVHKRYLETGGLHNGVEIPEFNPKKSLALYKKLVAIVLSDQQNTSLGNYAKMLPEVLDSISTNNYRSSIKKTLVHNDFNSRNIAISHSGEVNIYDWELAVINYPARDVVELLSFVLSPGFDKNTLLGHIKYHYTLWDQYSWADWLKTTVVALEEFICTRVLFYMSAQIVVDFGFADRVFITSMEMLKTLKENQP